MTAWKRGRLLRASAVVTMMALWGCAPEVHDTGFTGTWERVLPGGHSLLAIRRVGDGYAVRWTKVDGEQTVLCVDDGRCEEFVAGTKVCDWQFELSARPDSQALFLQVVGAPLNDTTPALSYVDRLELQRGGLELWSYQISEDGVDKDPPLGPRMFRKISDAPR